MRPYTPSAKWASLIFATGILLLGGCGLQADEFRPQTVIPRAFPPITRAAVMRAAEADRQLRPGELVLGVAVGEAARAYPINMLTGPNREIINDTLGGTAIAATW